MKKKMTPYPIVGVRFTSSQLLKVRKAAKAANLPLATFVRSTIMTFVSKGKAA